MRILHNIHTIRNTVKDNCATVLGRLKRWLLAMLAREGRAARGSGAAA